MKHQTKKKAAGLFLASLTSACALMSPIAAAAATNGRWQRVDNHWIFIQNSGKLAIGQWILIDGRWYNFDNLGYMRTGWYKSGNFWYYLKSGGNMAQNEWYRLNGIWYRFDSSGHMVTGWNYINGKWYYFNSAGEMQTGWHKQNSTWYYLHPNGSMATKWNKINGNWYYFDANGRMAARQWIDQPHSSITTQWESYYVDGSGKLVETKIVYKYGYTPPTPDSPGCGGTTACPGGTKAEAIANLQYQIEQAEYDLAKAKTAWLNVKDEYETVNAEQSIGFFKYMGWDNVEDWLTKECYGGESSTTSANYRKHDKLLGSYTQVGDLNDATSLQNMKAALDYLSEYNQKYRFELNALPALKVNNFDMLAAQLTANYVDVHYEHPYAFNLADCVLQTKYSPYQIWYAEQKVNYDVGSIANSLDYQTLVNPYYLNSGFAVCTKNTLTSVPSYAQTFGRYNTKHYSTINDGQPDMTLESYTVLFNKYYNNYLDMQARKSRYEAAQVKVDDLKAQLNKLVYNL